MLIKAIAQVVPAHTMSCFLLSSSLCEEMTSMVHKVGAKRGGKENGMDEME